MGTQYEYWCYFLKYFNNMYIDILKSYIDIIDIISIFLIWSDLKCVGA